MRERLMHLVSSFWLPLPFLTPREVDTNDQKGETWFLIVLHSLENVCLLLISRWTYSVYSIGQFFIHAAVAINIFATIISIRNFKTLKAQSFVLLLLVLVAFNICAASFVRAMVLDFDQGVFYIDLCLVVLNVLGILLSDIYQEKCAVYAGIPHTLVDLPSFGPEVRTFW